MLFYLSLNKWSLICSTFLGTINLLHFTPLFKFTHHAPIFGTLFQKNIVNLSFILLKLTNSTLLLLFLLSPYVNFNLNLKLISSNNSFLLSLFHTWMSSSDSLTFVLLSHFNFVGINHRYLVLPALRSTYSIQNLEISLHQFQFVWLAFAGTLNLFTQFTYHLCSLSHSQIVIV